jgi:ketosteroid isomerase-like protein
MRLFAGLRAVLSAVFILSFPLSGQDIPEAWQFDSQEVTSQESPQLDECRVIHDTLLGFVAAWNNKDLEGHMSYYWQSPGLLYVVDGEQFEGWERLYRAYQNGYPDKSWMGYIEPSRMKIKLLRPDLAVAMSWWVTSFPGRSKTKVIGATTMNLQKFSDGWKIVVSHSTTVEM